MIGRPKIATSTPIRGNIPGPSQELNLTSTLLQASQILMSITESLQNIQTPSSSFPIQNCAVPKFDPTSETLPASKYIKNIEQLTQVLRVWLPRRIIA